MISIFQIVALAIIQGLAELLPVSSSAHVIIAEKLMGIDPSSPEMTFLLVMLHLGTMCAVLIYFRHRWTKLLSSSQRNAFIQGLAIATVATGVLGIGFKYLIEHVILEHVLGHSKGEVEELFSFLPLISASLLAAGILIVVAGLLKKKELKSEIGKKTALVIGLVQGLCLPFRGFSRSGATISAALLQGIARPLAEDFSFALAVILTPPVVLLELRRLLKFRADLQITALLTPGLLGMGFSFLAGLVALKWLSNWLENGRWKYFGYYCVFLGIVAAILSTR